MTFMTTNKLARLSLFCAAISIVGCSSGTSDASRTRKEGTAGGAVLGAAVGAGVGAVASKNKGQGALVGAGAGVVAGGLAGAAAGDAVVKKKAAYIAREDALTRRIALVERQTAERRIANSSLRTKVTRQQQRLAELKAAGAERNTDGWMDLRKDAGRELAAADRRARTWQETIDAHKAYVRKYHGGARGADVEQSLTRMEAERTELLRQRNQLEAIAEGPRK